MSAYRIEHSWQGRGWRPLPTVYPDVNDALAVAEAMAENLPAASIPRVGYRTRVVNLHTTGVAATFSPPGAGVNDGPFGDERTLVIDLPDDARAKLREMADRSGSSPEGEARAILLNALGVWVGGAVTDDWPT